MDERLITITRLLAKYPQAIKTTTENVSIGDVICNHPDVPCVVVDEKVYKNITGMKNPLEHHWTIAKVIL